MTEIVFTMHKLCAGDGECGYVFTLAFGGDDYTANKPNLYKVFTGLLSQNNSKSSRLAAS